MDIRNKSVFKMVCKTCEYLKLKILVFKMRGFSIYEIYK